jgi:hypothetical protein
MKLLFHNQRYLFPVASQRSLPPTPSQGGGARKEEGRAGRRPLGGRGKCVNEEEENA